MSEKFIIDSGIMLAILPVKCWDGQWAWLRRVGWADVQDGIFYNPYMVERVYSVTPNPAFRPQPREDVSP